MPISGNAEITFNPNGPDVGSTTPDAIVPAKALALANGNTLLCWTAPFGHGGVTAMAQIFDAAGNALGAAFSVPTEFGGNGPFVDAVATPDGGFFVEVSIGGEAVNFVRYDSGGALVGMAPSISQWGVYPMAALSGGGLATIGLDMFQTPNGDGTSSYDAGAVLRVYDASGQLVTETRLAADVQNAGGGVHADLAILPNGNIVATWVEPIGSEFGPPTLHAQMFNAAGAAVSSVFVVDTQFPGNENGVLPPSHVDPVVAAFADGSFVLLWNRTTDTVFQTFNADGSAQGAITSLGSSFGGAGLFEHDLITLPDMTFVVGGSVPASVGADSSGWAVVAQQFNRDGTAVGDWVTLNVTDAGDQSSLQLTATPGGGFSAVWLDHGEITELFGGPFDPNAVLDLWRRREFSSGEVSNAAPVAQDGTGAGSEDQNLAGQAVATDANGNVLSYALVSGPAHGTLIFNPNGGYVYTPDANYHGADSFAFRANDGVADSNVAIVSLEIASVNDTPTLANPIADQSSAEDAPFSYTLSADAFGDVDGDALTLTARLADGAALPAWLNFDAATRTFTGTPPANFDGQIDIQVTATDGAGASVSDVFTLDILPANDVPTDIDLSGTAVAENAPNGTVVGTATAADPDSNDTRSYSLVDNAGGRFAINAATGVLTIANGALLNFEAAASHTVVIRVTDAAGASYDESFVIGVTNVNEAPDSLLMTAGGSVAENSANGTVVGQFAATDPDSGSVLSYSLVDNAGGRFAIDSATGRLTVANGSLLDFETATSHSIVVRVTDQGGLSRDLNATIGITDLAEETPINEIEGTDRSDLLLGTAGADAINAGRGADIVFAGGGDDIIDGGLGNDFLSGGSGNDMILGGLGRDTLVGGTGNDILVGGAGQDILTGGSGHDVFLFESIAESRPGVGSRDWITDFELGDLIDLSGIDANTNRAGDQAFNFVGNAAFSHTAGELRFDSNGRLQGDVNGDGVADFELAINFVDPQSGLPVHASDFIL